MGRDSIPTTVKWLGLISIFALTISIFWISYGVTATSSQIDALRGEARRRTLLEASALLAEIDKFRVLPFVLVELPDVRNALSGQSPSSVRRLDATLAALARQTGATVLYAVDSDGVARSASNAGSRDSFAGYDFRFRPYYFAALRNGGSEYFAQGTVTGRPGMFLARRVGPADKPAGVIVVKIEFDKIESLWRSTDRNAMVIDGNGIIIIASNPALRLRSLGSLTPVRRSQLIASRQFGDAGLAPSGLMIDSKGIAVDRAGRRFVAVTQPLPVPGWRLVHLEPVAPAIAAANSQTRFTTLIFALAAATFGAAAGWAMTRRRRAATAQRLLEDEVSRRTSELSDAYDRLRREGEERERADRRFRAAREELAQANRLGSIGTITTSVAHEINQPVAAIRTAAENAVKLSARGKHEGAVENMALIVSLTVRIGAITGELLSYARRGRGAPALILLDDVLDGALMLIGDSFVRAGVKLDIVRDANLPRIRVSRIRIEQVLVNLLQNALDEVARRSDPTVRLTATATPSQVTLTVEDNGGGVPPELSESIFQPFYTGKENGTGMGLGISREIVADHGGTLTVTGSSLGGARFTVLLPRDSREPR